MSTAASILVVLALAAPRGGVDDLEKFSEKRREVLLEAGDRHLELGLWARKKGLVAQATNELFLAVELSEGTHRGASTVLSLMRSLDDGFWKKRRPTPSSSTVRIYDNKARKALREEQEEFLELAGWALKKELEDLARAEYLAILRRLDAALEFGEYGQIVLEHGVVPVRISSWIRENAVTINGREYLRDAFLEHLPEVGEIFEVTSDDLRVRVTTSLEDAAALHALGTALLPILEEDLLGRPTRRMNAFVFPTTELYGAYLVSAGLARHRVAAGFANSSTFTAIVNADGKDAGVVQGILLHELTHLFGMGISRGILPSWYHEGLAELYGGHGTFRWDGETLETGYPLAGYELEVLRFAPGLMSLEALLESDALEVLSRDDERAAQLFYAQSWALVRFLREDASGKHARLFADWEAMCLGAALGAGAGARNTKPAEGLFRELFEGELAALEADLLDYVRNLF